MRGMIVLDNYFETYTPHLTLKECENIMKEIVNSWSMPQAFWKDWLKGESHIDSGNDALDETVLRHFLLHALLKIPERHTHLRIQEERKKAEASRINQASNVGRGYGLLRVEQPPAAVSRPEGLSQWAGTQRQPITKLPKLAPKKANKANLKKKKISRKPNGEMEVIDVEEEAVNPEAPQNDAFARLMTEIAGHQAPPHQN